MKTLMVVPCGRSKIWRKNPRAGPTRARDAYAGAPFKVNREYAEAFSDKWVILSAKYGFIEPGFIIPEDYNVTFNDPTTNPISMEKLKEQVKDRLDKFNRVVALGSSIYANMVSEAFEGTGAQVLTLTAGLPISIALGKVKDATRRGEPFGF